MAQQAVPQPTASSRASASPQLRTLTAAEGREFDAIASRILPSEPTSPGARELGVLMFADKILGGKGRDSLVPLRSGLAELSRMVSERHAGKTSFASLAPEQQDAILSECEASDPANGTNDAGKAQLAARSGLFNVALRLTSMGAFADPMYGGNRGKAGWRLMGFDDRHSWAPPFGALDRD